MKSHSLSFGFLFALCMVLNTVAFVDVKTKDTPSKFNPRSVNKLQQFEVPQDQIVYFDAQSAGYGIFACLGMCNDKQETFNKQEGKRYLNLTLSPLEEPPLHIQKATNEETPPSTASSPCYCTPRLAQSLLTNPRYPKLKNVTLLFTNHYVQLQSAEEYLMQNDATDFHRFESYPELIKLVHSFLQRRAYFFMNLFDIKYRVYALDYNPLLPALELDLLETELRMLTMPSNMHQDELLLTQLKAFKEEAMKEQKELIRRVLLHNLRQHLAKSASNMDMNVAATNLNHGAIDHERWAKIEVQVLLLKAGFHIEAFEDQLNLEKQLLSIVKSLKKQPQS